VHVCGLSKVTLAMPMFFAFPKSPQVHTMCRSVGSLLRRHLSFSITKTQTSPNYVCVSTDFPRSWEDALPQRTFRTIDAALSWPCWTSIQSCDLARYFFLQHTSLRITKIMIGMDDVCIFKIASLLWDVPLF